MSGAPTPERAAAREAFRAGAPEAAADWRAELTRHAAARVGIADGDPHWHQVRQYALLCASLAASAGEAAWRGDRHLTGHFLDEARDALIAARGTLKEGPK